MLQTFKATLNGDKLEWNEEIPEEVKKNVSVKVIVTILDEEVIKQELRSFGLSENSFIVPVDFDEPLPEEILADFEN